MQHTQNAINLLSSVYQQRGLSSATNQVCQMMVEQNSSDESTEIKALLHLCIGICFIDAAEGHTTSSFDVEILKHRLVNM